MLCRGVTRIQDRDAGMSFFRSTYEVIGPAAATPSRRNGWRGKAGCPPVSLRCVGAVPHEAMARISSVDSGGDRA
jgi:hypothetical protein